MLRSLEVLTVLAAAIAMALSLAHAAELPGKLRLSKEAYLATQTIYYPGFTLGAICEPVGILLALVLLLVTPAFWWTLGGLAALVAMHATYWLVTHPVNSFWLKDQKLGGLGAGFFGFGVKGGGEPTDWTALRDRWEYSHVARAGFALLGVILLLIAVTA
jgi:hypothetical protein